MVLGLCLTACQNKPTAQENVFGELDSTKVAMDTTMQVNMDRSYEYQKTLVENDTTVYDFLAYDKPKGVNSEVWESKFIVIKRTINTQDTVIKEYREGPVKGLSLCDLNGDGKRDILFYEETPSQKYSWQVRAFSLGANKKFDEIRMREFDANTDAKHYHSGDTFFVYQDHLIRRYPYYEKTTDSLPKGTWWQSYQIRGSKFTLVKEEGIL